MKKQFGDEPIFFSIVNLIVKKMKLFNTTSKMTDVQIGFFTHSFIEEFKHESISDLALCLTNAAMGKFGKLYGAIDPPIVFEWFRMHLDIKSQHNEKIQQRKKTTMQKQVDESPVNKALNKEMSRMIRMNLKEKHEQNKKNRL